MEDLQALFEELHAQSHAWFDREAIPTQARILQVHLDMRYVGQNFELQVPIDVEPTNPKLPTAPQLRELFLKAHEISYGFFNPEDSIEIIAVRLTARGVLSTPSAPIAPPGASVRPQPLERRPVWFGGDSPVTTPIYRRDTMAPGCELRGPAIIDQFDATTVVYPNDVARVDDALNLVVELVP